MASICEEALRILLKTKLEEFERRLRSEGLVEANIKSKVTAAKQFAAFLFGSYHGKRKQPYL